MNCLNFAGKEILVNWTYAYVQKFLWKMLQSFYHAGFSGNIFFPIVSKYSFMISFTQCSVLLNVHIIYNIILLNV